MNAIRLKAVAPDVENKNSYRVLQSNQQMN